jgi:hypothetical protein
LQNPLLSHLRVFHWLGCVITISAAVSWQHYQHQGAQTIYAKSALKVFSVAHYPILEPTIPLFAFFVLDWLATGKWRVLFECWT